MVRDVSVSLDEQLAGFVEAQIVQGRYGNAADVMRAGLHLLEREAKLVALQAALQAGDESGRSTRDAMDIWAAVQAEAQGA